MGKQQVQLADLYKVKEKVAFSNGDTEISVWVVKLNKLDHASAVRRAGAAQAKVLAAAQDTGSDYYQSVLGQIMQIDDTKVLINGIIMPELSERSLSIQFELEAEKRWADDEYLSGLRAAWTGSGDEPGLEKVWLDTVESDDGADPEAKRVLDALTEFQNELDARLTAEHEDLEAAYDAFEVEDLRDRAVKAFLKVDAERAFQNEYLRQRTFMSVRQPDDWRKRYFGELADLDECDPDMVIGRLISTYDEMSAEGVEGKGLRGIPASSPPSEPLDEAAASTGSDPEGASPSRMSRSSS